MNNYLVHKLGNLYKTKLIKLIFIADRLHFRNYGRTITNDDYQAQKLGPVTLKTLNLIHSVADEDGGAEISYFKKFLSVKNSESSPSRKIISSKEKLDEDVLSQTDIEILNGVVNKFGNMSRDALIQYTHKLPEWKNLYKETEGWKEIDLAQFIEKSLDKDDEASDYAKGVVLNFN